MVIAVFDQSANMELTLICVQRGFVLNTSNLITTSLLHIVQ